MGSICILILLYCQLFGKAFLGDHIKITITPSFCILSTCFNFLHTITTTTHYIFLLICLFIIYLLYSYYECLMRKGILWYPQYLMQCLACGRNTMNECKTKLRFKGIKQLKEVTQARSHRAKILTPVSKK